MNGNNKRRIEISVETREIKIIRIRGGAANLVEKAKTRVDMPDAAVKFISIKQKKPNFNDKDFQIIWSIYLQKGVTDGEVDYDNKDNEIYVRKNGKDIFRKK